MPFKRMKFWARECLESGVTGWAWVNLAFTGVSLQHAFATLSTGLVLGSQQRFKYAFVWGKHQRHDIGLRHDMRFSAFRAPT